MNGIAFPYNRLLKGNGVNASPARQVQKLKAENASLQYRVRTLSDQLQKTAVVVAAAKR